MFMEWSPLDVYLLQRIFLLCLFSRVTTTADPVHSGNSEMHNAVAENRVEKGFVLSDLVAMCRRINYILTK